MSLTKFAHRTSVAALLAAFAAAPALAADIPIPASVHLVKQDNKAGFAGKLAKIVAKPSAGSFPLPSGNPVVSGAYLRFFQTGAPQPWQMVSLPASGWKALGASGFKYKGAGSASGPCKSVLLKGNVIKAVCKGPGSTDSPAPYAIPVADGGAFELVIAGDRYCAESSAATGADIKKNDAGLFNAKGASAPASCAAAIPATCSTAEITITTAYTPGSKDIQGVVTSVVYNGPKLQLAGPPTDLNPSLGGIFNFGDNDVAVPGDFLNDTLTVGLVAIPGDIPPGPFASAAFNCRDGADSPQPNDFVCTSDVSDSDGGTLASSCRVSLVVNP